MKAAASRWARGAVDLAAKPGGREDDRLASGLFLLVTASGAVAGLLWAIGYALLGRPLSGAVPGAFALLAALVVIRLMRSRELGRLRELMLLLILLLPAVLQASLGGYVKGSAVIMWSFFAPLSALVFFGPRAGWAWLAGFRRVDVRRARWTERPVDGRILIKEREKHDNALDDRCLHSLIELPPYNRVPLLPT